MMRPSSRLHQAKKISRGKYPADKIKMLSILPIALIKHHKIGKPELPQNDNMNTVLVQAGKVGDATTQANIGNVNVSDAR